MERKFDNYFIASAYNYDTAYTDIEVYASDGEYIGTLNGAKYDFDEITEEEVEMAIEHDDYDFISFD